MAAADSLEINKKNILVNHKDTKTGHLNTQYIDMVRKAHKKRKTASTAMDSRTDDTLMVLEQPSSPRLTNNDFAERSTVVHRQRSDQEANYLDLIHWTPVYPKKQVWKL